MEKIQNALFQAQSFWKLHVQDVLLFSNKKKSLPIKNKISLYHWRVFHFRIGWNKQKSSSALVYDNIYTKYCNGAHCLFCNVERVMAPHFELISLPYLPKPVSLCYMFIFCIQPRVRTEKTPVKVRSLGYPLQVDPQRNISLLFCCSKLEFHSSKVHICNCNRRSNNAKLRGVSLTFRHRASSILGQAFRYSPESAFYIFNQQIYFIIWYFLDHASLI